MAIAFDSTGSAVGDTVTGLTIDVTSAAVGAWCYCWTLVGRTETSFTLAGWTQILSGDAGAFAHYAVFRRQKQSGDTTFPMSWPLAEGAATIWTSYTGLDPNTPDELAAELDHNVAGTSFLTPSLTPTKADRWALALFGNRGSALGSPPNAFTVDAALTDRGDAQNVTASHFMLVQAADSNAVVTAAAHSYTDTINHSSSNGATALLFLVPPATASPAGTVVLTSTRANGTNVIGTVNYTPPNGAFATNAITVAGTGSATVTVMISGTPNNFTVASGGSVTSTQLSTAGATTNAQVGGYSIVAI